MAWETKSEFQPLVYGYISSGWNKNTLLKHLRKGNFESQFKDTVHHGRAAK